MSLSIALTNGLSGLTASQTALATISQNVSNANTVGYSRQVVNLEPLALNGVGAGVTVAGIDRVVDDFLIRELRTQISSLGASKVTDQFFNELQARFGTPGGNTTSAADLSEFAASIETLANNPEDPALRFDVIAKATRLAKGISGLATDIQKLRSQADTSIKAAIDEINAQLKIIDELNGNILLAQSTGADTAQLEDNRDIAIAKIAENIDIKTFARGNGEITVLTGTGQTLLDTNLHRLDYTPATTVTSTVVFGAIKITPVDSVTGAVLGTSVTLVTSGASSAVTSNVVSGRLDGLLDMRDKVLNDLSAQVDSLASAMRNEYNKVHNAGVAFPASPTLTGTRTVNSTDAFAATGTVRLAVVSSTGAIVGTPFDFDLTTLGATTVGGVVTAINAALGAGTASLDANNHLRLDPSTGSIAINEVNSLVTGTTQAFSDYFGLNDFFIGAGSTDFAVRADIAADPSLVSTGRLSLTSAHQSILINDRNQTLDNANSFNVATDGTFTINGTGSANTISFDVDVDTISTLATKINAASIAGVTASVVNGAGTTARLVIQSTDALLDIQFASGGNFVTAAGFAAIAPTQNTGITIGDNRAIQQIAGITETGFTFAAVGGLLAGTFTLGEYAANIAGLSAVQAADAAGNANFQRDLFDNLNHRTTSFSGVNIDEEMANMILFQSSFTAAARLISMVDEMFDTLLNML